MPPERFDAVIAGGGLSGLSLAAHLAAGAWRDRSVLLVDDSGMRPAAVSWGFWTAGTGLLDAAASHTYRQVLVRAGGRSRVLMLGRYRYHTVRRPDLRRVVMGLVQRCPGFVVRSGHVERIRSGPDTAEAVVDGRPVRARWLFDSVSAPPHLAADAHLAFTGWQVRCARPVFDPAVPTLFDFRTPQAGSARFVYVLPTDACGALVELTEFVPRRVRPSRPDARQAALAAYLRDVVRCGGYDVERTESAVLALHSRPRARGAGRVLAIGVRGGLVKASTGYAYQRIQRDSAAIAASLARHGHPFAIPAPSRRHRLLDALLLDVLDRDPAQLERAFGRLFLTNPAERVLRFLDEDSSLRDELRLISSLPPAPYLRAALARTAGRAVRRVARYGAGRPPGA